MKVLKVPFSGGSLGKNNGCEKAPDGILKATEKFFLNESGIKPSFEPIDVKVVSDNISETNNGIGRAVGELGKDEFAVVLGGDHSITFASVKAFAEKHDNPGLVVLDAHPDCETAFSPPSHEDLIDTLVEEGIIKAENIILVGLRNMHSNEREFLEKHKINTFPMKEISMEGIKETCSAVMNAANNFGALYLSIDIDSVDPAFAPGTGYPEPGGFTSRELLHFVQRLRKMKNIKMADIVEINPEKDVNGMTVLLGAKILTELYN